MDKKTPLIFREVHTFESFIHGLHVYLKKVEQNLKIKPSLHIVLTFDEILKLMPPEQVLEAVVKGLEYSGDHYCFSYSGIGIEVHREAAKKYIAEITKEDSDDKENS